MNVDSEVIKGVAFRAVSDGIVAEIAGVALVFSVVSKCAGVTSAVSRIADGAVSDEIGAGNALVI